MRCEWRSENKVNHLQCFKQKRTINSSNSGIIFSYVPVRGPQFILFNQITTFSRYIKPNLTYKWMQRKEYSLHQSCYSLVDSYVVSVQNVEKLFLDGNIKNVIFYSWTNKGPDRNCASPIKWCKWPVWICWIFFSKF